jgi:hypothetical protein
MLKFLLISISQFDFCLICDRSKNAVEGGGYNTTKNVYSVVSRSEGLEATRVVQKSIYQLKCADNIHIYTALTSTSGLTKTENMHLNACTCPVMPHLFSADRGFVINEVRTV